MRRLAIDPRIHLARRNMKKTVTDLLPVAEIIHYIYDHHHFTMRQNCVKEYYEGKVHTEPDVIKITKSWGNRLWQGSVLVECKSDPMLCATILRSLLPTQRIQVKRNELRLPKAMIKDIVGLLEPKIKPLPGIGISFDSETEES